jgi:hypothetical protein
VKCAEEDLGRARGFSSLESHFVEETDGSGGERVRTKRLPKAFFNRQLLNEAMFTRKPAPGTTRIMFFGGSTVYGWPYDGRLSFTAWLKAGLPAIPGGERIEILNFGAPGYGSSRLANLAEEALEYEPDIWIIITTGSSRRSSTSSTRTGRSSTSASRK